MRRAKLTLFLVVIAAAIPPAGCHSIAGSGRPAQVATPVKSPTIKTVIDAAIEQTTYTSMYDPSYTKLGYPGGDVALERGVCSDVVVRAFRKAGVDLQKEVHEDMTRSFAAYPQQWGATRPDANIDHRRVPNLMTYFKRSGKSLPITQDPKDYAPGDVVAWDLGGGLVHIGLVSNLKGERNANHSIVHNIGAGVQIADALFSWKIIGHYRYFN